jgi:hypothetical protein
VLVVDWTKRNSNNKLQDIYIAGFLALSEHEIEAHQTTRKKKKKIQHNNENERLNRKFRREEFLSDTIPFRVIGQFDLFQFSRGPAKKIQFHFFLYRLIYLISFFLSIVDVSGSNTLRNNKKKSQSASSVAGWIIVIRWMLQPATKEAVCDLWRPF